MEKQDPRKTDPKGEASKINVSADDTPTQAVPVATPGTSTAQGTEEPKVPRQFGKTNIVDKPKNRRIFDFEHSEGDPQALSVKTEPDVQRSVMDAATHMLWLEGNYDAILPKSVKANIDLQSIKTEPKGYFKDHKNPLPVETMECDSRGLLNETGSVKSIYKSTKSTMPIASTSKPNVEDDIWEQISIESTESTKTTKSDTTVSSRKLRMVNLISVNILYFSILL